MSLVTSSKVLNIVYGILMASDLPNQLTGDIYIGSRPGDSELEDVVINGLPITMSVIQNQFVNVNLFVKDIERNTNHNSIDSKRIGELSQIILDSLIDVFGGYYSLTIVENDDDNPLPEINQHYANFRLLFQNYEPINN